MQILGGKVTFLRRVQATQYEPQEATVELSFAFSEWEELGDKLDQVAALAQNKAREMVGLKPVAILPNRDKEPSVIAAGPPLSGTEAKEAYAAKVASEKIGRGGGGSAEDAQKIYDTYEMAEKPEVFAGGSGGGTGFYDKVVKQTIPPDVLDISDLKTPKAEQALISDGDLMAAVTNLNAIIKDPKKIRDIRDRFVQVPKGIRDIEQKDRPTFLAELEKLKASK